MQLLTASNINMLMSSKPTLYTGRDQLLLQCTNSVYFSYLNNNGNASFCCWDTKSDAFYYVHTIGSNTEVPGTPSMMKKCEIDIDA